MGKAEIRDQLYEFLERGTEYAYEELRPVSVVAPDFLPGNGVGKLLIRPVIDDSAKEIEMGLKNELTLVMDYAEERAWNDDTEATKYKRKFLESDIFFRHYEGNREDELEDALVRHFEEMAHDMTPLIRTDADGFWGAMREEYDKYEAEEILRHHFSFVEGVAEEFGDGVEMDTSIGPVGIDYTSEALRILPKVETKIRREAVDELDEVYGSRYGDVGSGEIPAPGADGRRKKREAGGQGRGGDGDREVAHGNAADEKMEKMRERLKELEAENEKLREELKEERERKDELKQSLEEKEEEKQESYKAEDWLG
jgi:hypothetical protein